MSSARVDASKLYRAPTLPSPPVVPAGNLPTTTTTTQRQQGNINKRPADDLAPLLHGDNQDRTSNKRQHCALSTCPYELYLSVKWFARSGKTRTHRLPLLPVSHGVDGLQGIFKRLIKGAYSSTNDLPSFLSSPEYYLLSPAKDFVSLPCNVIRTQFRLVACLEGGWEYTLAERELGESPDPDRKLIVTVAEFESDVLQVGDQQMVVNLVSYPTVCVKKDFLDMAVQSLVMADDDNDHVDDVEDNDEDEANDDVEDNIIDGDGTGCGVMSSYSNHTDSSFLG